MFEKALEEIKRHSRIIIHRHTKPDGDAVGSQAGLKLILRESFPGKEVLCVGDGTGRYSFIRGGEPDAVEDGKYKGALAVILDTSSPALISDGRYALADATLRIDHHLFSGKIADTEVCDNSFESCCGMITAFACECGLCVTPDAAEALYAGTVTDSGRFRYDSTNEGTLRRAAFLLASGADAQRVYASLYREEPETVKLRASYIMKITQARNGVAYIYTTREELAAANADPFAISRAMVGTMADIRGIDIWVNFTEYEGGVLCELRSSRFNINPVAVAYGGGGHAKASGTTVADRAQAMRMLRDLEILGGANDE